MPTHIPGWGTVLTGWERAGTFAKIDLLKGYWQVPLTERAKEVSAFVVQDALFACKVRAYEMKSSAATSQRLMNRVLTGLTNCTAYTADVIVYSDIWDDHFEHLKALFSRLVEANLVINLKKREFAKATVTCLGHVTGRGQVLLRRAKVQTILDFLKPTNKRVLMRFGGNVGVLSKILY